MAGEDKEGNKVTNFFKKVFRITTNVIKAEGEEIVNLKPTEEDYELGDRIAMLAVAAMASCGIPSSLISQKIIAKAVAYGIRNLKEGIMDNDKLFIERIIKEIVAIN